MLPYLYEILSPSLQGRNVIQVVLSHLVCGTGLFISEWNKLDTDVRNIETYSLFRKNLLSFIRPIENSIYNIYVDTSSSIILKIPWTHYAHVI